MSLPDPKKINLFPGIYVVTRENPELPSPGQTVVKGVYANHALAQTNCEMGDQIHGPFSLVGKEREPVRQMPKLYDDPLFSHHFKKPPKGPFEGFDWVTQDGFLNDNK